MFWDLIKRFPPWVHNERYEKVFEELGIGVSASRYLTFVLVVAILLSVVFYFLGAFYIGLFVAGALLAYPWMLKKEEEQEMLAHLPLFLIDLGALLNIGVPLLEAMRLAAKNSGRLRDVIERILKRVEKNESLSEILLSLIQRYEHPIIKRAFTQLIAAIETGSGKELKQLGVELLKQQVHTIKEFGSKLSVITQFFISFNIILPVFVVLLIIAMPLISNTQPSLSLLNHVLFILFPLLGITFLLFAYIMFPQTSFTRPRIDWQVLALGIGLMAILYGLRLDILLAAGILIGIFIALFAWNWKHSKDFERRLEEEVPELLLMLSAFPRFDLQEFFQYIAESNLKVAKEIAQRALNIIKSGQNPSEIFQYLKRFKGILFSRFVGILEFSYYTGSSLGEKLAEWAEALYQYITAKKEIEALFLVQKYTLLIGAIIVPAILGAMVKIFRVLFELDIAYIYPFVLASTALIFALINLLHEIKLHWFFLLSAVGLILFHLAGKIM